MPDPRPPTRPTMQGSTRHQHWHGPGHPTVRSRASPTGVAPLVGWARNAGPGQPGPAAITPAVPVTRGGPPRNVPPSAATPRDPPRCSGRGTPSPPHPGCSTTPPTAPRHPGRDEALTIRARVRRHSREHASRNPTPDGNAPTTCREPSWENTQSADSRCSNGGSSANGTSDSAPANSSRSGTASTGARAPHAHATAATTWMLRAYTVKVTPRDTDGGTGQSRSRSLLMLRHWRLIPSAKGDRIGQMLRLRWTDQ